LVWGIRAFYYPVKHEYLRHAIKASIDNLKAKDYLVDGDIVVHVGDLEMHEKGRANMLKASYV
jgi:pyruvate kinase